MVRVTERIGLVALVALVTIATWPARSQAQETGAGLAAPRSSQRAIAVVDTATVGIDPIVGEHVTTRVQLTAQELGYQLAPLDAVREIRVRLRAASPPSPADLWRIGYLGEVDRVIVARAFAEGGRYVVEVIVASLDGTGPFRAMAYATAQDLHDVVASLVRQVLPPPSRWDADAAARLRAEATAGGGPGTAPGAPPAPLARSRHPGRRWDVAFQTESAIGAGQLRFYNHLLGARLDIRITRSVLFGAYFGYANLRGRNDRVSNLLAYAMLEDRIEVVGVDGLTVPLRAGAGYLPFNGPFVRISAGVNYAINDRFEFGADILAPTFWFTPENRVVSFNVALEGIYRFGASPSAPR